MQYSGQGKDNVPMPLPSLAKHLSGVRLTASLRKLATQARIRASARPKVKGKGHAKVRAMGPGLRHVVAVTGDRGESGMKIAEANLMAAGGWRKNRPETIVAAATVGIPGWTHVDPRIVRNTYFAQLIGQFLGLSRQS